MLCVPILSVYLLSLSLSIFMHNIYLGYETNRCGEGCNFEVITFDCIYPFLKKTYFKNGSKTCSTKYDFNIPDLSVS